MAEHRDQRIDAEPIDSPPDEITHPGLRHAKQGRRPGLGQTTIADQLLKAHHQLGAQLQMLGLPRGKAEVTKHVTGSTPSRRSHAHLLSRSPDRGESELWYRRGYALGTKEPAPQTHPRSLWDYRLAHALGRIAARRGDTTEAWRQIAAARRALDAEATASYQKAYDLATGHNPPAAFVRPFAREKRGLAGSR